MASKHRRLRLRPARREDRLSALPDELLHLILRHVDTRTALGTATLSKRWAAIPRELPALDLRVTDALPPRYHRCLRLRHDAFARSERRAGQRLTAITDRYERRATRAMARSVEALLATPARRRVGRLSIEVFAHDTSAACINRLVEAAVDSWGVEHLDVVATPTKPHALSPQVCSFFPHGRISADPGACRLRTLELSNCQPPPLHGLASLTTLVLRRLPRSTPMAAYTDVLAACPQLQVLRLVSCECEEGDLAPLLIDAPSSEIRELVVETCFMVVMLRSLPKLESLTVSRQCTLRLRAGAAPRLARVRLAFFISCPQHDQNINHGSRALALSAIWDVTEATSGVITDLVLRLTGPDMWIMPKSPFAPVRNLRRLLVADVPSSWDASWPRLLVDAAPLLESMYVHYVSHCSKDGDNAGHETEEITWQPSNSPHRRLKELVVVGFQTMERRQVGLIRFAMEASTALRRVALYRHGHVVEHEEGERHWEVVVRPQCAWSDEEKRSVLEQITEGRNCCLMGRVEVVLG